MEMYNPPHPGTVLKDVYLEDYKLSISAFALKIGVSRNTASELINGKNRVTAEMALKLSKAFNVYPQFWLDLQVQYDLWQAKQHVNLDNVQIIAM
jgi:addiction module HigA family antidote